MTIIRDINGNTMTGRGLGTLIRNLQYVTKWSVDSRGAYTVDFTAEKRDGQRMEVCAFVRVESHAEQATMKTVVELHPEKGTR